MGSGGLGEGRRELVEGEKRAKVGAGRIGEGGRGRRTRSCCRCGGRVGERLEAREEEGAAEGEQGGRPRRVVMKWRSLRLGGGDGKEDAPSRPGRRGR